MSTTEKFKQFMEDVIEKDDEIKRLKEENEKLRQENERLKQNKGSDYGLRNKAVELKKVLDDFVLGQDHQNRPIMQRPPPFIMPNQPPYSVSIPTADGNVNNNKPSTSTNNEIPNKPFETSVNGTNHSHFHPNYVPETEFSIRQGFNRKSDADIITDADNSSQRHYLDAKQNPYGIPSHNLPTAANRRFNTNTNGMGGMNNSRNHRNQNNHNNNNNNKQKYTIFISWTGTLTSTDQLQELFDPNDVEEVRYTDQKQFAHVDLKSENALNKAMALNGEVKNEAQGALRVERGKPRSSNNTENGQRSQHQKNYNRQNNKNANGYPNPQKNFKNYNNHNSHGQSYQNQNYSNPSDEKDGWGPYPSSGSNPQEHTKQSGGESA